MEETVTNWGFIHISIQELGFDGVDFLPNFPSDLRAVFINTAISSLRNNFEDLLAKFPTL